MSLAVLVFLFDDEAGRPFIFVATVKLFMILVHVQAVSREKSEFMVQGSMPAFFDFKILAIEKDLQR